MEEEPKSTAAIDGSRDDEPVRTESGNAATVTVDQARAIVRAHEREQSKARSLERSRKRFEDRVRNARESNARFFGYLSARTGNVHSVLKAVSFMRSLSLIVTGKEGTDDLSFLAERYEDVRRFLDSKSVITRNRYATHVLSALQYAEGSGAGVSPEVAERARAGYRDIVSGTKKSMREASKAERRERREASVAERREMRDLAKQGKRRRTTSVPDGSPTTNAAGRVAGVRSSSSFGAPSGDVGAEHVQRGRPSADIRGTARTLPEVLEHLGRLGRRRRKRANAGWDSGVRVDMCRDGAVEVCVSKHESDSSCVAPLAFVPSTTRNGMDVRERDRVYQRVREIVGASRARVR